MRGSISLHVIDRFDAQLRGPLVGEEGVVSDDTHAKGERSPGDRQSDASQAHDAQRLVGQLGAHVGLAIPRALQQALIGGADIARQRQHQGEGVLGGTERVARGRVHDHDAQPRGHGLVDIVGPDAGAHDGPQPPVALQGRRIELHTAAANGPFVLEQRVVQLTALQPGLDVELDALGLLEQLQPSGDRLSKTMIFGMTCTPAVSYRCLFLARNSRMKSRSRWTPASGMAL